MLARKEYPVWLLGVVGRGEVIPLLALLHQRLCVVIVIASASWILEYAVQILVVRKTASIQSRLL